MNGNDERMSRLFRMIDAALERSESEREAFVRQACADEPGLADEVMAALSPSAEVRAVLDTKDVPELQDSLVGREIERFRIEAMISEGGMGAVYRAVDTRLQRTVALKFVHSHHLGARIGTAQRARFRREILTLAKLDHAGIAKIYDDAFVPVIDGVPRPFFSMEFIDGEPISTFVERTRPDVRRVISLLADAGEALAHAHSRGVIHRDIKPTNVLVTREGVVKLIDFGIAKSFDDEGGFSTAATAVTMEGGRTAGTMGYMSPEQLKTPDDVDIRTDVYSLGVLAYELLTGTRAFELRGLSLPESLQRLETMPAAMGSVSAKLRGEVETMVQKAMERDRVRRYQSAGDFVADLRAFLEDRPISARPPSRAYRVRKFAKRNPGIVTAAAAGAIALGVSMTAVVMISAKNREISAHVAEIQKINEQYVTKGFELNDAAAVLFKHSGPDEEYTPQDAVEFYENRLSASLKELSNAVESPDAEAAIRWQAATVFLEWGDAQKAEEQYKHLLQLRLKQHGADHPDTAAVEASLAFLYLKLNRIEEASTLAEQALRVLRSQKHLRWQVEAANTTDTLAQVRHRQGRLDEGAAFFGEELDFRRRFHGPAHANTATAEHGYARLLLDHGRTTEAEAILRRVLAIFERDYGPSSLQVGVVSRTLGASLRLQDRHNEATPLLRQSLKIASANKNGADLAQTVEPHLGLALLDAAGEQLPAARESESLLRSSLLSLPRHTALGRWDRTEAAAGLTRALTRLGRLDEAWQTIEPELKEHATMNGPPRVEQQVLKARIELAEAIRATRNDRLQAERSVPAAASVEEVTAWKTRLNELRTRH